MKSNDVRKFRSSLLIIIFLVISFHFSPVNTVVAEGNQPPYYFVNSWGGEAEQMLSLAGLTWREDGTILAADNGLSRITLVNPKENTYSTWGYRGLDIGQFQGLDDVAMDKNGNAYTIDMNPYSYNGAGRIQKWDRLGNIVESWAIDDIANGITVDGSGYIYVTSKNDQNVRKYSPSGELLLEWGGPGSAVGLFNKPEGITTDSNGTIYVVDTGNQRVQIFSNIGEFITSWTVNGQYIFPDRIAISPEDTVYVTCTRNGIIQVFSNDGKYIKTLGSYGNDTGQFSSPTGIAINDKGNIAVADSANHRIQVFSPDGSYYAQYGATKGYSNPFSFGGPLAIDQAGNILIVDNSRVGGGIQKFNANMEYIPWPVDSDIPHTYFDRIWDLDVDQNNNIFISQGNHIDKYDQYGNLITYWGSYGSGNGQFKSCRGIAIDPIGNIFVTDIGNLRIQKFDNSGNFLLSWNAPEGVNWTDMEGIASDSFGNIYVVDTNVYSAEIFDNDGRFIKSFGTFFGPADIFADGEHVFVVDTFNIVTDMSIQMFTLSGAFVTAWGSPGSGTGRFTLPDNISEDSSGNIYIGDESTLQKFASESITQIQDGSFEDTSSFMNQWSRGGALPVSQGTKASSGSYSLQLGQPVSQKNQKEGFAWVRKNIYIDPSYKRPILSFQYDLIVNDIRDYSDFFVEIQDGVGLNHLSTVLHDGYQPCIPGVAPAAGTDLGWRTKTYDLSAYKGQYIRIVFSNRNLWPESWGIWTYVDDVKVMDAGPLPIPTGSAGIYLPLVTTSHCDPVPAAGISATTHFLNQP